VKSAGRGRGNLHETPGPPPSAAAIPTTVWTAMLTGAAGHPALLHIDRENADLHREQSLAGFPPRAGYDRDEYPVAMSEEGGYGASVRYIDPADNRGAGSSMGNQLEEWCEEQPFRIRFVP
jgi:hypothetical protein